MSNFEKAVMANLYGVFVKTLEFCRITAEGGKLLHYLCRQVKVEICPNINQSIQSVSHPSAGEQLIIMEMNPLPTPDSLHFYNLWTRNQFHLMFTRLELEINFPKIPLLLTRYSAQCVWVWIYCGVFATIEGSIAPHLSPLVPQSGYNGANMADWVENNKRSCVG